MGSLGLNDTSMAVVLACVLGATLGTFLAALKVGILINRRLCKSNFSRDHICVECETITSRLKGK